MWAQTNLDPKLGFCCVSYRIQGAIGLAELLGWLAGFGFKAWPKTSADSNTLVLEGSNLEILGWLVWLAVLIGSLVGHGL